MLAALSRQLFDMLCCVLNTGHKCLFSTEWWVTFEVRNGSSATHYNGLAIVSTTKVLILISHSSIYLKYLMHVPFGWNIYSNTETELIWKGKFEFCSLFFECLSCSTLYMWRFYGSDYWKQPVDMKQSVVACSLFSIHSVMLPTIFCVCLSVAACCSQLFLTSQRACWEQRCLWIVSL